MNQLKSYQKIPVVIQAIQFDGTDVGARMIYDWLALDEDFEHGVDYEVGEVFILTENGFVDVQDSEWVIKEKYGHLSVCDPKVFEATYEEAQDD